MSIYGYTFVGAQSIVLAYAGFAASSTCMVEEGREAGMRERERARESEQTVA